MKERITYMTSPMSYFTRWPIATRVLTTVLEGQGFNIEFFDASLLCYVKAVMERKDINIELNSSHAILTNNAVGSATSNFSRFPHFYVGAGMLDDFILSSIKTDTVFYSAPFAQDFRLIKLLLDRGKRVMLGGTVTLIHGIDFIRKNLNLRPEQEKQLCIVQGYVDQTTPLKQIYEKWEDHIITTNDYKTIWDCDKDWTLRNKKIYDNLFHTNLGLVLNTSCWWGRCKYCTHPYVPAVDFTEGMTNNQVVEKIIKLSDLYGSKNIFFFDPYMKDTRKKIMKALKEEGFKLSIYTGLHLFNEKYIKEFINECQLHPSIGLEHTNDLTLKAIDKGLTFQMIEKSFDNMIKYMDKSLIPLFSIIADLPIIANTREEAIDIIKNNYDYIIYQKRRFESEGFKFQPDLKSLRHLPMNTLIGDLIREAKEDEFNLENIVGIWALYLYMSKVSGIKLDRFDKETNKPLVRLLPNGERLESDLYFIDKEIVRELSTWQ